MNTEQIQKLEDIATFMRANPEAEAGPHWLPVECELGTELPVDYKMLVDTFGAGDFCNSLSLFSPFSNRLRLMEKAVDQRDTFKSLHETFGKGVYSIFPEADGLLPIAGAEDGKLLMYETIGHANDWCVVWMSGHMQEIETFRMGLGEYLLAWIHGDIRPEADAGGAFPPISRVPFFRSI